MQDLLLEINQSVDKTEENKLDDETAMNSVFLTVR
jgi:hypothetical protein